MLFIFVNIYKQKNINTSKTTIIYPSWDIFRLFKKYPSKPPIPPVGGCAGTRYGCCSDGKTSKKDMFGSNCLLY